MKKNIFLLLICTICGFFVSCNEDSWLEREPKNMINDPQLWNDPVMIKSLLSNYYNRLPTLGGLFKIDQPCEMDDAMWSGHYDQNWDRNEKQFADDYGRYWDYGFIRDINLAIENLEQISKLSDDQKKQFNAELRLIRAFVYFELVKRMGGVPIITKQMVYDFSGDPSYLQAPRAQEFEVYDFIYNEIQEIKGNFIETQNSRTRGNEFIALALQSRAMLYAGSLAKYNNLMSAPITTPGGEVGIPSSKAADYYQKSLTASQAIIANPMYELYKGSLSPGENFYQLFMDKSVKEVIFAKDFLRSADKLHFFTYDNVVRSFRTDIEGSSMLTPSLNLLESFPYLDGSKGSLRTKDADGNYIVYDNPEDIFANKDPRLYGTIVYPGANFRSKKVDMQAGIAEWENGEYKFRVGGLGSTDKETGRKLTGMDGPIDNEQFVSNTGLYIRKFVSEDTQAGIRPTLAENWWPWFRLGEIYLNAAEAAFELGNANAKDYINKIRERAGFPANSVKDLTLEIIQNERRIELAFEDHRFFDLKRWRIADKLWTGQEDDSNAVVYGLFPYRIYRPGHDDDNKYIYVKMRPNRFKRARFFRMANYYSSIEQKVLNNNPKLVKNPFH